MGQNGYFNFTLVDVSGNPISGQTVYLTLSKGSASKVYTIVTDSTGKGSMLIGLGAGTYTAELNYKGNSKYLASAASTSITITNNNVNIKDTVISGTTGSIQYGSNYEVVLLDSNGNPVSGQTIYFTISKGTTNVTYSNVTNSKGIAYLKLNLASGAYNMTYSFEGSNTYAPISGTSSFSIYETVTSVSGNALWLFGKNMYSVDLDNLKNNGVNAIFLSYGAFSLYTKSAIESWISTASSKGIDVYIWMQILHENGSFYNPVISSTGAINTTLLDSKVNDAITYASTSGIKGVLLDYIRYEGNAYQYNGSTAAINTFVSELTKAIKTVNSNLIVAGTIMPETTSGAYYYGQDVSQLGQYLDVLMPMLYKGNYGKTSTWITSTTKWYVQNGAGALVWAALQGYKSDNDVTLLSATELANDVQAAYDGGACGVSVFRYGLTNIINFTNYESIVNNNETTISIDLIGSAATSLKDLIEKDYEGQIPEYVGINGVKYTTPQFLYFLSTAIAEINNGSTANIPIISISGPSGSKGTSVLSNMNKTDYLSLANSISNYMSSTNSANPGISSNIGVIQYNTIVYTFTKVMAYYYNHKTLPASVVVTDISDNYYINVIARPSASNYTGFKYAYYNTTFINYCPDCDLYGTLLINPKNVSEVELTCAICDSDYCAVTGKEKIVGSTKVLTKVGVSVLVNATSDNSTDNGSDIVGSLSINDIKSIANTVSQSVLSTGYLPSSVTYNGVEYTIAQVSYLMGQAILNINSGNNNAVDFVDVNSPNNSTGSATGTLTLADTILLVNRIIAYVNTNNALPNFDKSSSIGQISFESYTYAFSKMLVFVNTNARLPNSVSFDSSTVKGVLSSNSTNSTNKVYVSIADVISAAERVQAFIVKNGRLPLYTTLNGVQYEESRFAYLMATALLKISAGQTDNIAVADVSSAPNSAGDNLTGQLSSTQYLALASRIIEFVNANGYTPNFDSSNGLGKISYDNYVYIFANILTSYASTNTLPTSISVNTSIITTSSSSSSSDSGSGLNEKGDGTDTSKYLVATNNCEVNNAQIKALAASLTSGLTSSLAKATAIFNYVRDEITYSFYANTKYGAVGTLNAGKGNCVDHAHLVIALCRAAGIPARYVHGKNCVFSSGLVTGHVWAQIYVDGVWKVADATSKRNSLGNIVNWNTGSFTLAGIYSSLSF